MEKTRLGVITAAGVAMLGTCIPLVTSDMKPDGWVIFWISFGFFLITLMLGVFGKRSLSMSKVAGIGALIFTVLGLAMVLLQIVMPGNTPFNVGLFVSLFAGIGAMVAIPLSMLQENHPNQYHPNQYPPNQGCPQPRKR